MDSQFISPISVEKFAAYLDGNLPEAEMQSVSSLINKNVDLAEIIDACDFIDEAIEYNSFLGQELPEEIRSLDFEIPNLDDIDNFEFEEINPWENVEVACANDDNDLFYPEDIEETEDTEECLLDNFDFTNDDDIDF